MWMGGGALKSCCREIRPGAAPEPGLDAYQYPGGETEGWVILQVAVDETDIMVIFEPIFAFTDEDKRFMSLEP
jgi:hypothetical protein